MGMYVYQRASMRHLTALTFKHLLTVLKLSFPCKTCFPCSQAQLDSQGADQQHQGRTLSSHLSSLETAIQKGLADLRGSLSTALVSQQASVHQEAEEAVRRCVLFHLFICLSNSKCI